MANEPTKGSGESGRVTPKPAPPAAPVAPATKAAARKAQADREAAKKVGPTKRPAKAAVKAATRSGNPRTAAAAAVASSRYTPPIPASVKISPWWVPALMFGFLGLGMLVIFFNYIGFPFGDPSNWRLLAGLGAILAGIITATQYH